MEAEKPKIKVPAQSVTGEGPLFAGPHMTEQVEALPRVSADKAMNPIMRALSSQLNHLTKALPPNAGD